MQAPICLEIPEPANPKIENGGALEAVSRADVAHTATQRLLLEGLGKRAVLVIGASCMAIWILACSLLSAT